jgi:hypothetical protein
MSPITPETTPTSSARTEWVRCDSREDFGNLALSEEWDAGIGSRMYSFDDELDLACAGIYGDAEDVTTRLQRFLDEECE